MSISFAHGVRLTIREYEEDPTHTRVAYGFELRVEVAVVGPCAQSKLRSARLDFLRTFVRSARRLWPDVRLDSAQNYFSDGAGVFSAEGSVESFGYSNRKEERWSFKRSQATNDFRRLVESGFLCRLVASERLKNKILDGLLDPLVTARAFVNAPDLNAASTSYSLLAEHKAWVEREALAHYRYEPIWLDENELNENATKI
jgi:hypothetical protein